MSVNSLPNAPKKSGTTKWDHGNSPFGLNIEAYIRSASWSDSRNRALRGCVNCWEIVSTCHFRNFLFFRLGARQLRMDTKRRREGITVEPM